MKIIDSISVLGDSLSKGIVLDDESKKYKISENGAVDVFGRNMPIAVTNYAKFGCTTDKSVKIADRVIDNGLSNDLVLVEFGGNDCDFNWNVVVQDPTDKTLKPNVTLSQFKINVQSIIDKLRSTGKRIAMMTLPPVVGVYDLVHNPCIQVFFPVANTISPAYKGNLVLAVMSPGVQCANSCT